MSDFHFENDDERIRQQHQSILISNKVQILINSMHEDDSTFDRIVQANKRDELCQKFYKILTANVIVHNDIKFRNCCNVDDVLYMKNKLWVSESQQVKLFQKVHDQSANDHLDKNRIIEFIEWFYYWLRLKGIVERYIRNCDFCQKSKAPRDKINDFLISLLVSKQRWRNIVMNFIVDLLSAKRYNVICIIIDRFIKKRHYVFCWSDEQGLNAEKIAFIIIWNVFRFHELSDTIVSDKDSQFISMIWKHMCARLHIKTNMSTAFHSLTNE